MVSVLAGSFASILDILLLVGMGLGIQLEQSRACAVIAFVYSILSTIIGIIT